MGAMGKTGHQELGRVCFRSGLLCETPTSPPAYAEAASRAFDALSADLARARAAGASVAVLSGFPVADRIGPAALYRTLYDQGALPEAASFSRTGFAGAARWTNDFVGRAAQKAQVALVDPTTHLCSATDCPYIQGARPLYYDDHHLRGATVRGQAFAFLDKLVGLGPT
jgi:hypothetical protein